MSRRTSTSSSTAGRSSGGGTNGKDIDKKWDLTPYEEDRGPQEVMTDHETRMALHPECLRSDFMCPICLKLQSNTVAVMGCLHRFCKDCIVRALDNSKRECPVCRAQLPNKRYLRPDPNFDMLISRLFPLREEDTDEGGDGGGRTTRSTRQNSRKLRTRYARDASPDSSLVEVDPVTDGTPSSSQSPGQSNGLVSQKSLAPVDDDVEVVLEPLSPSHTNPKDWLSQKRYIKTSPNATVDHMIKYLSTRYRIEVKAMQPNGASEEPEVDESLFTLCIPNGPGQFKPVKPEQTLGNIKQEFEEISNYKDKHLILHYAYDIGIFDDGHADDLMDALPPGPPPPSLHPKRTK